MPRKRNAEVDMRTIIIKMLIGAIVGTIVFFLLTALAAVIMLNRDVPPDGFGFTELALGAFAGVLCGFIAVKPVKKKGFLIGALSTMPMFLVITCVCILVLHREIGVYGWVLGGVLLLSGSVGGIIAVR